MFKYPIYVTLDTNIFDAAKYDFSQTSTLSLLKNYVKKGKIKVVLSDIVIREAQKHISEKTINLCSVSKKVRKHILKEFSEHHVTQMGLDSLLQKAEDPNILVKKARETLEDFIKDINAEILTFNLIDLDTIINDYFEINPPFENNEKKRKEFPDAFIASQIIKRFDENDIVAIISTDNGFKNACKETPNHIFFDSLGKLYNKINEEETITYNETIDIIKILASSISEQIFSYVELNENIDVIGKSYDRHGIPSGYDYSDIWIDAISKPTLTIHSVDELTDTTSTVTLVCNSKISVDCLYEDYDNSPWDPETKDYIFVNTGEIREEHNANFACSIEIDRNTKTFKIHPFKIILGGDTRTARYEIDSQEPEIDYEQEYKNMQRIDLGFHSLDDYTNYLEEDLPNSNMTNDIIQRFKKIETIYHKYEDFCELYDNLLEKVGNNDDVKPLLKIIYNNLKEIPGFPIIVDEDNITDEEIIEIQSWINNKAERSYQISENYSLPDTLNYGETIYIPGADNRELELTIDEIQITPIEGSEECIDIRLSDENDILATGTVKLTVGYLNFNDDGGVTTGTKDDIEYIYYKIIEEIDNFIETQEAILDNETKITNILEESITIFN